MVTIIIYKRHRSAMMCYNRGDIVFEESIWRGGIINALICSPHADPPKFCFGFLRSHKHSNVLMGTIQYGWWSHVCHLPVHILQSLQLAFQRPTYKHSWWLIWRSATPTYDGSDIHVQTVTCTTCCWLCQIFSSCLDCAVGLCMHAATCTAVLALLQQACACNHAWWLPSPRPSFAFSQLTDVTQSIFLHFCNAKQYLFTLFFGLQFGEKQQHCTYRSRAVSAWAVWYNTVAVARDACQHTCANKGKQ